MFAWCCALGAARRSLTATQLRCLVAMVAGCCALVVASWLLTIRRCALVFNPLRVMVDFLDCFFLLILVFLHLNRIKVGIDAKSIDAKSFRKMKKKSVILKSIFNKCTYYFFKNNGQQKVPSAFTRYGKQFLYSVSVVSCCCICSFFISEVVLFGAKLGGF